MALSKDNNPYHAAINDRLGCVIAVAATPPPWTKAWARLGPESTDEERLAVYRAVRDAASVPEEAAFYLVSWQIDAMALRHASKALRELETRIDAIKQAHGLTDDEGWPPGAGPPEYEAAQRQLHEAWDALYATTLDDLGEHEMARLFRTDRQRFEQLSEAGRRFFHGSRAEVDVEATDWLKPLLDAVSACVDPDSPMGPLGARAWEEDGIWDVWIYPTPVELVGGSEDGLMVAPGFALNLEQLRSAFDSIADFGWEALGLICDEGPHIYIQGLYQGHTIVLQVLAEAPENEEPGLKFDWRKKPWRPE